MEGVGSTPCSFTDCQTDLEKYFRTRLIKGLRGLYSHWAHLVKMFTDELAN